MNEAHQPTTVTVRALLAHFHGILAQARRTGEPIIIALRRRTPTGVLLGYETWQALQAQAFGQADISALQAELAAERQRNGELAADLVAARQRIAELAAQLAAPQPDDSSRTGWGVALPANATGAAWHSEPTAPLPARLAETWTGQPRDSSEAQQPLPAARWGLRGDS